MLQVFRSVLQDTVAVMPYYAVRIGRRPGVYSTWPECQREVDKFAGARYKKFNAENEAWEFVNESVGPVQTSCKAARQKSPHGTTATAAASGASAAEAVTMALSVGIQKTHMDDRSDHVRKGNDCKYDSASDRKATLRADSKTLLSLKHVVESLKKGHKQMHQYLTQADELVKDLQQPGSVGGHSRSEKRGRSSSPEVLTEIHHKTRKVDGVARTCRPDLERLGWTHNEGGSSTGGVQTAVVYTDGCCVNNGMADARAGIGVYWGPGDLQNTSERLGGRQTNNRAEIHAAVLAIRQAKRRGVRQLIIRTDSQFMINSITKWIHKWKTNGWVLSNGGPVVNRKDFEELEQVQHGITVKWEHVRGHQGIEGNEAADRLANEGALKEMM